MLTIVIPPCEFWNEITQEFMTSPETTICLEHSLVSISKWEAKWKKPFMSSDKTDEELLDYVKCMTLTQNVNPIVYSSLSNDNMEKIVEYIKAPMTATWFNKETQKKTSSTSQVVTSEVIYYWMIQAGIPFECQKWHLNRLLTLIRVCGENSKDPKKYSKRDLASQYTHLNNMRRKARHSRG